MTDKSSRRPNGAQSTPERVAIHWRPPGSQIDRAACGQDRWAGLVFGRPEKVRGDVTCRKCRAMVDAAIDLEIAS